MNEILLTASARVASGSKAAGRLRRAGKLPGVIKRISGDSLAIQLDAHEYEMTMRKHHGDQILATITVDGTPISALLRETQHDVMSGAPSHVDFGEVDMGKTVRVEIALELVGTPEGVKNAGGVLEHNLRAIHVDCLPVDIVETFNVDVSALNIGDKLTVAQLDFGKKYHITTHKDTVVAAVIEPDEEIVVAAPVTDEAAAPEVIAKGKADADAAAADSAKKAEPAKK